MRKIITLFYPDVKQPDTEIRIDQSNDEMTHIDITEHDGNKVSISFDQDELRDLVNLLNTMT